MQKRLCEKRTWNATQLAEAIEEEFSLVVSPEAVRQHLISMGHSWKRTRYSPDKEPDPEQQRQAREELEDLKGGSGGPAGIEIPRRERVISVSAPDLDVDEEGLLPSASSAYTLGLEGPHQ
jgi:hypothetical protein